MILIRNIGFIIILIMISVRDIKEQKISNISAAAGFLIWAAFQGAAILTASGKVSEISDILRLSARRTACAAVISFAVLAVVCLSDHIFRKQTMGMGDVKLIFIITLYLGFWNSIYMLFAALVLGLLSACLMRSGSFPFGPCISLSAGFFLLTG